MPIALLPGGHRPRRNCEYDDTAGLHEVQIQITPTLEPYALLDSGTEGSVGSGLPRHHKGASLAGNYGAIARRATRGLCACPTLKSNEGDQSTIEVLLKRLCRLEQQLDDTREEVKQLRGSVAILQSCSS